MPKQQQNAIPKALFSDVKIIATCDIK